MFLLLQQWRRVGCFVKFPYLRQTPLCGVRDHLIIDLAHRCTSSSPDTILQFCLELQMAIEPFCALGTESFLETIWKEMAICYLIYTLYADGKYWILSNSSLSFMDICTIVFQCSRKEATLVTFFNIIIIYLHIAQYAVSTTNLLPFFRMTFMNHQLYTPSL